MNDSEFNNGTDGSNLNDSLFAVDLNHEESIQTQSSGSDLTEAKEALVDALLNMTKSRCTGEHEYGEYIFGTKPSAKLVSGFLLPRYDEAGTIDETSDIHISTMGMDFQVSSNDAEESGEVKILPSFSFYVRVLPSWDEITNQRFDMRPQVRLSFETQRKIEIRANELIQEMKPELPEIEDEGNVEKEGAVIAEAKRKIDQIKNQDNINIESSDSVKALNENLRKQISKNTKIIENQEEIQRKRIKNRKEYYKALSKIRKRAFDTAYREFGIRLIKGDSNESRLVSSKDFVDEVEKNDTIPEQDETEIGTDQSPTDSSTDVEMQSASESSRRLHQDVGQIEDKYAAPQPIPQKWKRIDLDIGEISFEISDLESVEMARGEFKSRLKGQINKALENWIETEEGQSVAFRTNERILPSQFSNEENWNKFLSELRQKYSASLLYIRPQIDNVELVINIEKDFIDSTRQNVRVSIENRSENPSKTDLYIFEHSIFQVELTVSLSRRLHRPLKLTRIESSERYRDWLDYAAMGLNCGVSQLETPPDSVSIRTTWVPRFTQPRIVPRNIENVPTSYAELAESATNVEQLYELPNTYDSWISENISKKRETSEKIYNSKNRGSQKSDNESYKDESRYIRAGIDVLVESQRAFQILSNGSQHSESEKQHLEQISIPWRAWIYTNKTFCDHGKNKYTDWRLFQLAFILAHIPTFASRIEEFKGKFDYYRDELSASLLYFPTGGGKSEAFFGLLVFNLFLDRLRGKNRGITALIRYPLRLLTLQQARRLTKLLVCAELVRIKNDVGNWPFELGFWVGSGNTPNRVTQGFSAVPSAHDKKFKDDSLLLPQSIDVEMEEQLLNKDRDKYRETLEDYDKLCECPCCGEKTGMRKYPEQYNRIGIVCFNNDCDWNKANPTPDVLLPLPFIFTDDTIYQRAPSIILGTIDKLALIGQHDHTINSIVGMFGCARYMDPVCQHLFSPRGDENISDAELKGKSRLYPAFSDGKKIFYDPFPSLIIQDEGHLLTESLGTFTGLFETTLEKLLLTLGKGILKDLVATWSLDGENSVQTPRFAKVVAATATISDPDRQLRVLYQRESFRFPCSGISLYESFYSYPQKPRLNERIEAFKNFPNHKQPELTSPWMRIYSSIITNGHSHSEATSTVISSYHISYTVLWNLLQAGNIEEFSKELMSALSPEDPLTKIRLSCLNEIIKRQNSTNLFATLLDLLRTSLTYVSSKKGGDLIIDTLGSKIEKDQYYEGIENSFFASELISGGVTIAEIQDIMKKVETNVIPGDRFESIENSLRNIVATSAISHGVDVEKFNSMFFLGVPTDIAEYIQASSRVGRSHPGFCLLIPTPHSRRDRFVVETHDQFHRFLERMISPPAVQRWADRAIRRILPSLIQTYLCGIVEQEYFFGCNENKKTGARTITSAKAISNWVNSFDDGFPEAIKKLEEFAFDALGILGRGTNEIGGASHKDHYRNLITKNLIKIIERFTSRTDSSKLSEFWREIETDLIQRPMTSLRDIDVGGVIQSTKHDPKNGYYLNPENFRQAMKAIRGQKMAVNSDLDAD